MVTERVTCSVNSAAMPKPGVTDVDLSDDASRGASGTDSGSYSDSYSTDSAKKMRKRGFVRANRDKQQENESYTQHSAPKKHRGRSRSTGRRSRSKSAVAETGRTETGRISQDMPALTDNKPDIRGGGDSPRVANRREKSRRRYCKRCEKEISGVFDADEYKTSGRCLTCAVKWAARPRRRRRDTHDRRRERRRSSTSSSHDRRRERTPKRKRRTSHRSPRRGSRSDSR